MAEKTLAPPKNRVNPGTFGPGVIGASTAQRPTEAQLKADPSLGELHREDVEGGEFEKETAWKTGSGQTFGPGVIGEPQPQKPTAAQLRAQPELGPLHGVRLDEGGNVVPIAGAAPPDSAPSAESGKPDAARKAPKSLKPPTAAAIRRHRNLPVAKIEETLGQADYLFDQVLRAELKRVEGPRKAALRILLKFAKDKGVKSPAVEEQEVWFKAARELEEALKPKEA